MPVVFLNVHSLDSSGFEHVFVGETRSGSEIVGFHNWIQFYLQEKNSHLDYKGYKARDHDLVSNKQHNEQTNKQTTLVFIIQPRLSCVSVHSLIKTTTS